MVGRELTVECRKEQPRREVFRRYVLPMWIDSGSVRFRLVQSQSLLIVSGWKTAHAQLRSSQSASSVRSFAPGGYLSLAALPKRFK